jgi:hypothetical protein
MYTNYFVKILMFWIEIMNTNNCMIKNVYNELLNDDIQGQKNCVYKLKSIFLENYAHDYLWEI